MGMGTVRKQGSNSLVPFELMLPISFSTRLEKNYPFSKTMLLGLINIVEATLTC